MSHKIFGRSTEVQNFDVFLKEKAEKGFGLGDRLRYAYVNYQEAEGLAKALAWLQGGGVGALYVGNIDDYEGLKKQAEFYNGVCKVQATFKKYMKTPDRENYDEAVNAFEAIAVPNKDDIHMIIGKNVSDTLLERFVEYEITKSDKTSDNIVEFANGFEELIKGKIEAGYAGDVREALIRGYNRVVFKDRYGALAQGHDEAIRSVFETFMKCKDPSSKAEVNPSALRPLKRTIQNLNDFFHRSLSEDDQKVINEQVTFFSAQDGSVSWKERIERLSGPQAVFDRR